MSSIDPGVPRPRKSGARSSSELALLVAAIEGDRPALLKLLSRSRRDLYERIARRIPARLRSTVDADDVVQNTHVEVMQRIREFQVREEGAPGFERWVTTIAIGKLRDALRRQRAAKRGAGRAAVGEGRLDMSDSMVALYERVAGSGQTPSRVAARDEMAGMMRRAIEQLPDEYRGLIWSIYIEGRSMGEIAAESGRTEGAIRVACHKARRRLREMLGDSGRFFSHPG